jgi:hypothetical protein
MKKRLLPITILASLGVAALAGCGESGGGGGGGGSVIDVTGVTLNKTSASLFVGGTEQLVATIAPADATDKAVTWSSADKNVVTVDANGLVAAVGVGETAVTVTTNDGAFKASCDFTVKLDMKSLTITNKEAFKDGLEEQSSASVSVSGDPAFNATVLANKGYLTVTSSNQEVATTSKLMINALTPGKTTITASLFGKSDSFELTVTEKPVIDVNYGTAESPLGIATALTEVAKLGLENKAYSPKPFYISGKISAVLAPASQSGYIFSITDDTNKMDVSSCLLEDGKTAADYGLTDVVTIVGYLRADSSKSGGYYLSYNNGAATGTSPAPQIIAWQKGEGGEEVPEPEVTERTLKEFIDGENTKAKAYLVSGEIKAFKSGATKDKYGNMTLTDGTNDLIIYGATMDATRLVWNKVDAYSFSNPNDFMSNETTNALNIGDTVKMKLIRCDFNTTIEGQGIIVDITPGGGGEEVPEPAVADKTLAEFIALEDSKALAYNVTAEVKSFKDGSQTADKYGNMVLTDGTNDLVIYGASATATALAWNKVDAYSFSNPYDFLTNEITSAIKVGDTVKMKLIRADFKGAVQGTGIVLNVIPGEVPAWTGIELTPASSEVNLFGMTEPATVQLAAKALPAGAELGEVSWSSGAYSETITVVDGLVTIPVDFVAVGGESKTIVVTATASDDEKVVGTATIAVKNEEEVAPVGVLATLDFSGVAAGSELGDNTLATMQAAAGEDSTHITEASSTKVYAGNGQGGIHDGKAGLIKFGTSKLGGQLVITFDGNFNKVEISCHDFYGKSAAYPTNSNKIAVNGGTPVLAPYNETGAGEVLSFDLASATNVLTIDTTNRVVVFSIVVSLA